MITVNEAKEILQENMPEPKVVDILLAEAFGRRLSQDLLAPEPSPRYTNSAMDGYAVRWEDWQQRKEENCRLQVIGESRAGVPFMGNVRSGTAVVVSTGAMIPDSADTVVRIEDTDEFDDCVKINNVRFQGQDVRYKGEEFEEGELLFRKGTVLTSREIALLAAVGMIKIPVFDLPKVCLLITGTELAQYDVTNIEAHQIRDSNSIMLANCIRESGAVLSDTLLVQDSLEETISAVTEAREGSADVILCSGGISVGRHDHVKNASKEQGFKELFWRIRQKPGKPLFAGRFKTKLLFGLPGNPVSAFMCFTNYVRPLLRGMQGAECDIKTITGELDATVKNTGKRTNFIRVNVRNTPEEVPKIRPVQQQGSHMLSTIVHADGYVVLEPGEVIERGALSEVTLF